MFDWTSFFDLAEELADASSESHKRSAISRAYYSAYHTARLYVQANDPEGRYDYLNAPNAHRAVREKLSGMRTDRRAQAAAAHLNTLRQARNMADYTTHFRSIDSTTTKAIRDARWVVRHLSQSQQP